MKTSDRIRLPSTMPSGVRTRMHPLLWMIEHRMPTGWTIARIAREIGVAGPTLHGWLAQCREDRDFRLPALRCRLLAQVFGVSPSMFDPVTFAGHWVELP